MLKNTELIQNNKGVKLGFECIHENKDTEVSENKVSRSCNSWSKMPSDILSDKEVKRSLPSLSKIPDGKSDLIEDIIVTKESKTT